MSDFILKDGDKAIFFPTFGAAVVAVRPGVLKGIGPATLNGKNICVEGDEKSVSVPGCSYITPLFSIPGTGTLKIFALAEDQTAQKTYTGDKLVMLKGSNFTAKFEVQSPAMQPPPVLIPDPTPQYSGQGNFVTSNTKVFGT